MVKNRCSWCKPHPGTALLLIQYLHEYGAENEVVIFDQNSNISWHAEWPASWTANQQARWTLCR